MKKGIFDSKKKLNRLGVEKEKSLDDLIGIERRPKSIKLMKEDMIKRN